MKKIIIATATVSMLLANVQGINANAKEPAPSFIQSDIDTNDFESVSLSEEQKEALAYYQKIFIDSNLYKEYSLDSQGRLVTELSDMEIQNKYALSDADMEFISDVLETNHNSATPKANTRMTIKNFRVYLTYSETKSYLGGAITAGPVAVTGALAVIGAAVGGPLGSVVCGVAGIYGASYIVSVANNAIRNRRGVWIGWGGIGLN